MLKHSRWLLLKRPEHLTDAQQDRLADLVRRNLRTVRAYLLKEHFQLLWGYVSPYWAGRFLDRWCTRTDWMAAIWKTVKCTKLDRSGRARIADVCHRLLTPRYG